MFSPPDDHECRHHLGKVTRFREIKDRNSSAWPIDPYKAIAAGL